jgi:hypothetical protein
MDRMRSTSTKGERTELTQNNFAGNSKKKSYVINISVYGSTITT